MIRGHLISVGRIKLGAVCHGREKLYAIDMTLARRMMQSSLPVLVHCGTICTRLEQQGDHLGMARRGRVVEERGTVLCVGSTLGSFGLRRQEGTHPFCGASATFWAGRNALNAALHYSCASHPMIVVRLPFGVVAGVRLRGVCRRYWWWRQPTEWTTVMA